MCVKVKGARSFTLSHSHTNQHTAATHTLHAHAHPYTYANLRSKRLEGDEYFDLVDEFMVAVNQRWPNVIVQFEDFETSKAVPMLAKYLPP